jgi:AcrR family transcriptional regulator
MLESTEPQPRGRRAKAATRTNDPEKTRDDILNVAFKEFADNGYSGARVDEIAARTRTSKRMIYYYFESKDGLYKAVLTEYYLRLRGAERTLNLQDREPLEALRELVGFTFDYHSAHPEGVRLIMVENIHQGSFIAGLPNAEALNSVTVVSVRAILERGVAAGVIRPGVDPVDLYQSIAALAFFNVSNKATFSQIFSVDMGAKDFLAARRRAVIDAILRFVTP